MKFLFLAGLCVCMGVLRPAMAQQGAVYPDAAALRATLLALAAEQKSAFQNIKGSALNRRGTVQYYNSTLHIVPADTPKVCEDTNPLQVYYMDFVARGLTEVQSKDVYKKWQDLIKVALPGCDMRPDGNQYPDLESLVFTSADGGVRFTLYRNGTGNGCQVSITFMHIGAPGNGYKNTTPAATAQQVDVEGVHIDAAEFARQLNQLLVYARSGFKDIKGPKDKSEDVDKYATTYKMNGAKSQEIIYFPFLGTSYDAVYMEGVMGTKGNALFDQLRKMAGQSLPAGFKDEGVSDDGRMKRATYSSSDKKVIVEINRSLITHLVTVIVQDKSKY